MARVKLRILCSDGVKLRMLCSGGVKLRLFSVVTGMKFQMFRSYFGKCSCGWLHYPHDVSFAAKEEVHMQVHNARF